ncbi:MAG: hypothetical protein ACTSR8_13300 [Promethearchaeota archaeon]
MIKGLLYDNERNGYHIRDLEVSITNLCNLECEQCGFFVPNQRIPYIDDPIKEITNGIKILKDLGITIHRFPILGGEPLIDKYLLQRALESFRKINNFDILEIVTNGLIPQGITHKSLELIDEFTISLYFKSEELLNLWREWLKNTAPHVKFNVRIHDWDYQYGDHLVSDLKAQEMYEKCWYRKHCTTIERNKLFICSRIAKCGEDKEGLELTNELSFDDIESYLNSETFLPSCRRCTPMMGFRKTQPGRQSNNKMSTFIDKAIKYLKDKLNTGDG